MRMEFGGEKGILLMDECWNGMAVLENKLGMEVFSAILFLKPRTLPGEKIDQ